jgi:L-aminopeptidase/D-esterase-like protein
MKKASWAQNSVGADTGMIPFEFAGRICTSSRVLPNEAGGYTVGVLVQVNDLNAGFSARIISRGRGFHGFGFCQMPLHCMAQIHGT